MSIIISADKGTAPHGDGSSGRLVEHSLEFTDQFIKDALSSQPTHKSNIHRSPDDPVVTLIPEPSTEESINNKSALKTLLMMPWFWICGVFLVAIVLMIVCYCCSVCCFKRRENGIYGGNTSRARSYSRQGDQDRGKHRSSCARSEKRSWTWFGRRNAGTAPPADGGESGPGDGGVAPVAARVPAPCQTNIELPPYPGYEPRGGFQGMPSTRGQGPDAVDATRSHFSASPPKPESGPSPSRIEQEIVEKKQKLMARLDGGRTMGSRGLMRDPMVVANFGGLRRVGRQTCRSGL